MIVLYSGTGAGDFDASGPSVTASETRAYLNKAQSLLLARGRAEAAKLCRSLPFGLRRSWNVFNDDFHILIAVVSLKDYEAMRHLGESREGRQIFKDIASAVSEIGPFVRFVAIELADAPAVERTPEETSRALTQREIDWVARHYIGVNAGYLGDFSYRTHEEFYADLGLDITPNDYPGTTRARFEQILFESPLTIQATILEGVLSKYPEGSSELRTAEAVARIRGFVARLGGTRPVAPAHPTLTSAVVERALDDAERLIGGPGAISAVDRMHTALHGYLLQVCTDAGVKVDRDASLALLLKTIREQHPHFQAVGGGREHDVTRILKGLGSMVDALSPIRNNASVAHPNEDLLEEPEAMLTINMVRAILHYVDSRLR